MRKVELSPAWADLLSDALASENMKSLRAFIQSERESGTRIYPEPKNTYRALELVEPQDVKVVILGQDPYHGAGQAHGLSFSVQPGISIPRSLRNIYKELQDDLGFEPITHGFLEHWANQGVLLLNDSLTVEHGKAGSHRGKGWESFTDTIIAAVSSGPPCAFLLWGNSAKKKAETVDASRHLIIATSHPSPMGNAANKGFFGSRPFSRANDFLKSQGRTPIDWQLPKNTDE